MSLRKNKKDFSKKTVVENDDRIIKVIEFLEHKGFAKKIVSENQIYRFKKGGVQVDIICYEGTLKSALISISRKFGNFCFINAPTFSLFNTSKQTIEQLKVYLADIGQ